MQRTCVRLAQRNMGEVVYPPEFHPKRPEEGPPWGLILVALFLALFIIAGIVSTASVIYEEITKRFG